MMSLKIVYIFYIIFFQSFLLFSQQTSKDTVNYSNRDLDCGSFITARVNENFGQILSEIFDNIDREELSACSELNKSRIHIKFHINKKGKVIQVILLKEGTKCKSLDKFLTKEFRDILFIPGECNGKPVNSPVFYSFLLTSFIDIDN